MVQYLLVVKEDDKSCRFFKFFIKPHHKTIGHIEVKAMKKQQNHEVTKALEQLEGGREEIKRAHGHLLDTEWSYIGAICLPNLSESLKTNICKNLKICNYCSDYILVGEDSKMKLAMDTLLQTCFPPGSECSDEMVWREQYRNLASRILALEHLTPPVSQVKRLTGREEQVTAAFNEGL